MSHARLLSLATALLFQLLTLVPATEAKRSKSGSIDEEENLGGRIAPPARLVLVLFSLFLALQILSLVPSVEAAGKKGKGSSGGVEEEAAAVRIGGSGMVFMVMVAAAAAAAGAVVW